ncbi:MAG: Lrp/AsnC family transcriptional regulator [Gammaproteobacteria bacterium]|nr:Lrp/AsnC family transcriptional regulator [Gammaproteobacteria bacterium]
MDMKTTHPGFGRDAVRIPLSELDLAVIGAIQAGLPLVSRPYAALAAQLGIAEAALVERLASLHERGVIKRMGLVVRHRELGYGANAMVVWDVPDGEVAELGRCLSKFDFVTLCYRRPRQGRDWPYNLFCMIHGQDREEVRGKLRQLVQCCGLEDIPHTLLFSRRRFKQRGARYRNAAEREPVTS